MRHGEGSGRPSIIKEDAMRAANYAAITDIATTIMNTGSAGNAGRMSILSAGTAGGDLASPLGALSREAVSRWCTALPAPQYVVTVRDELGGQHAHARLTASELLNSLAWLRYRNARGAHIEARPWSTGHILVDGLTPAGLVRLATRHQPAVVVEAGLGLVQAWVTVADDGLEPGLAASIARHLATRYGGVIPAASPRALGRLPLFTHPAAQRHPDGRPRFLRVLSASPGRDRNAVDLIAAALCDLSHSAGAHHTRTGPRRCRCNACHEGR